MPQAALSKLANKIKAKKQQAKGKMQYYISSNTMKKKSNY